MEEIVDAVMFEVENSGYMDKLSAGIVLTGGGALLSHLPQLVKFKTGLDVRVGYPAEKLAKDLNEEVNEPMFSTSVGLLLKGAEYLKEHNEVTGMEMDEEVEEGKKVNAEKLEKEKNKFKGKLFDSIRKTMSDIFEEDDSRL